MARDFGGHQRGGVHHIRLRPAGAEGGGRQGPRRRSDVLVDLRDADATEAIVGGYGGLTVRMSVRAAETTGTLSAPAPCTPPCTSACTCACTYWWPGQSLVVHPWQKRRLTTHATNRRDSRATRARDARRTPLSHVVYRSLQSGQRDSNPRHSAWEGERPQSQVACESIVAASHVSACTCACTGWWLGVATAGSSWRRCKECCARSAHGRHSDPAWLRLRVGAGPSDPGIGRSNVQVIMHDPRALFTARFSIINLPSEDGRRRVLIAPIFVAVGQFSRRLAVSVRPRSPREVGRLRLISTNVPTT